MPDIIAVDPSLNGTGVAYRDGFGEITTERFTVKKLRGLARVSYVKRRLTSVLDHFHADTLVIEDYAMGVAKGRGMTFSIGEVGGVIKLLAYERGMSVVLVSPATLKKYVTGKGNAPKETVMEHAQRRWGRGFDNDDECDAFCLLKLGERYFSRRKGTSIDWSTLRTEKVSVPR